MSININKITSKISNSAFAQNLPAQFNNLATSIGKKIDNVCANDKFQKVVNAFEPTGGDNSWLLMMTLMLTMVVGPRVNSARKRNPDNKEATKDEIKEILFRDIQTIAIILLALKSLNAGISGIVGKMTGIPMSTKPYQSLFEAKGLNNKVNELLHTPVSKAKTLLGNVWDTINPLGGKYCYTKEQAVQKYSGYASIDEIQKMFIDAQEQKGDPKKIFNIVFKSLVQNQEKIVSTIEQEGVATSNKTGAWTNEYLEKYQNAKNILEELKQLKDKGYDNFKEHADEISSASANKIISILKSKDKGVNPLVAKTDALNTWLKTIAYGIEIGYLGFGLPFLNQKRLEKKYLKSRPNNELPSTMNEIKTMSATNKKLKEQEIKLYHDFIK